MGMDQRNSDKLICFHCGEVCDNDDIRIEDKIFCCQGCRIVYEIIAESGLDSYYDIENKPGIKGLEDVPQNKFAYLDDAQITDKLLDFQDENTGTVTFSIPQIHCSACIWLLENLHKFHPAIRSSKVNFLKKEAFIVFSRDQLSLRRLVEMLASIGYAPDINLQSIEQKNTPSASRKLWLKLGVAGFAFGNVMLLSFPEYLAGEGEIEPYFLQFFSYLNILLSLPVLLYSASDYFRSAWVGLRKNMINMDVPISLGMLVLLGRSYWEIFTDTGTGYLDSFTGLVFFLLIGKLFQQKTYDSLSFERDYKSYFPISTTLIKDGGEEAISISKLKVGDRIIVRNRELIPADATLLSPSAQIDYSFVTGESRLVTKKSSDFIYAGGRLAGMAAEFEINEEVSQSYLTRLWNHDSFTEHARSTVSTISDTVSRYFTYIVFSIALIAGLFWLPRDMVVAWDAFTAVLIIACPCALALSIPFTLGNALRLLGRSSFIAKNIETIENLAGIDMIIFDKTGTLTMQSSDAVIFHSFTDESLTQKEMRQIKTLARQSTHPLSYRIYQNTVGNVSDKLVSYEEVEGAGISGEIEGKKYQLGSKQWLISKIGSFANGLDSSVGSSTYVAIDGKIRGRFEFKNTFRPGLEKTISELEHNYTIALLSGDSDHEREQLQELFGTDKELRFEQSPADKLEYILEKQRQGKNVLMIGDGLNDAGALKQSDVGVAISDDISAFSPACDAILVGNRLHNFSRFLNFSQSCIKIVYLSFILSFIYNIVGFFFAVQGLLSPLFAAILMPLSSITVVSFATLATTMQARRKGIIG
ncbi:MAG: heavy metal translocating P-type ATPase metal-binding domain-containing protein [Deferribacteres bacterium]|nr:heavy metal translocating P-type ATPase metal-binding domain-containing protein [candidate division KSB1 bacterium]MCB9502322.1 heavy metal translocating P-type ATPase metal-binding domain-containing protein [Deferribacteres bacterium]